MTKKINLKNYNLYVVRLDERVLQDKKFLKKNPGYIKGKPCSYVGSTDKSIEERVNQHRSGYILNGMKWHNTFVKKHFKWIQWKQFKSINPIKNVDYLTARSMEAKLANKLRKKGHGVWQA